MAVEHSYTALRAYERCVAGLMADPEVTGDLLLVGLWLARATILRDPPPGEGRWSVSAIARDMLGPEKFRQFKVREALRRDLPRYDPLADNRADPYGNRSCRAPMVRRAGECGQHGTMSAIVTDLSTGRGVQLNACRRHKAWYDTQVITNRDQVKAAGDSLPKPTANTGGALARHIRVDWPKFYRKLDPSWAPPAAGTSIRKPSLKVIRNAEFELATDGAARPALTVVTGGWR